MSLLFFDLETIPGEKPEFIFDSDSLEVPKTYAKTTEATEKWLKEQKEKAKQKHEEDYRKQATKSHKGKILCLGYKYEDDKEASVLTGTEEEIIKGFEDVLFGEEKIDRGTVLVGHNIREFDIPWVYHRACKYGCDKLKRKFTTVGKPKYDNGFIDTMELFAYSSRNMVSMDDICKFFGIEGKGDIDGSMVYDLFLKGELQKIYDYCKKDVLKVETIYDLLT